MVDEDIERDIDEEMEELSEIGEDEAEKNEEIKSCLRDLKFPVLKTELVEFAKEHCNADIVQRIEKSPVEKYNSVGEVEEMVL